MKRITISLTVLILVTLVMAVPARAVTIVPFWKEPELIFEQDSMDGKMTGQDRFLDVDNFGNPGVALPARAGGAGTGFWHKLPGAAWNFGFATGSSSAFSSFAFDRSEQPVIVSISVNAPQMQVSRPDLFGYATEIPALAPAGGGNTSLAIDPLGRTGIAYVDELDNLKYMIDVDGNGAFDDDAGGPAVASLSNQMQRPSLAFDPQARPMVAFINGFTGTLNYDVAQFGINFGGRVEPDPTLPMVDFVSLAVNPLTGFPGIAYNDQRNGLLKYTQFDGADWNVETVHTQVGGDASDMSVSLAFDPADGRPAIAFTGDTNTDRNVLQFAWFDGGAWNLQTVDDRTNIAAEAVSLAFHEDFGMGFGDGVPAIAYISDTGQVHYIEDPPLPVPEPSTVLLAFSSLSLLVNRFRGCRSRFQLS
jgi:hypothetical protein